LTPSDIKPGSNKKAWWQCHTCGHEWQAAVNNRNNGTGCPACAGKDVTSENSLAVVNPVLASEWHTERNGNLIPSNVTSGSGKKAWWKCHSCGHEWEAAVNGRNRGSGCPVCAGNVAAPENCLAAANPALAAEWHPKKNGILNPDNVKPMSNKKVWWKCGICGHEWEAAVYSRSSGIGCPACAGRTATSENCLAHVNPVLASEWHRAKNGGLTPNDVTCGSGKKVWWKCHACNNEWQATVDHRSIGGGCPVCALTKDRHREVAVSSENCLAATNPALASYWHPTKNGDLTPNDVTSKSNKKVWWRCPTCGHEWETMVKSRSHSTGCPSCARRIVTSEKCLATTNPVLASEWHPARNGELTPNDLTPNSGRKAWWQCRVCGYEWAAVIANRNRGSGCPSCSGKVATPENCLSAISPALAAEWYQTKNGDLTPDDVTPNSGMKVWWQCRVCGHEWEARVNSRHQGRGCPVCAKQQLATPENCLAVANPTLAAEWHPTKNGVLTPNDVKPMSNKKAWWQCRVCGHEWEAIVSNRNNLHRGCPACAGQVVTPENCLAAANPDLAAEWHPTKNGELTPSDIKPGSGKKIWWQCHTCGHEWEAVVASRNSGIGCPACANSGTSFPEKAILYYMRQCFGDTVLGGSKVHGVSVDVFIPHLHLAIEYDGFHYHEKRRDKDELKNKKLYSLGIRLVRVSEPGLPGIKAYGSLIVGGTTLIDRLHNLATCLETNFRVVKHEFENLCRLINLSDAGLENDSMTIETMAKSDKKQKSLAVLNPDLAAEWHPTKNGHVRPENVHLGSSKNFWWKCCVCGHEWKSIIANRSKGNGCPACAGQVVTPENCLSAISPALAAEWHPTKNGDLTPDDVTPNSGMKVWWQCRVCRHEWESTVDNRSGGSGCPACAGFVATTEKCLSSLNPILATEWHPTKNGERTPDNVMLNSGNKFWWKCRVCGHEWEALVYSRSAGRGCPECAARVQGKRMPLTTENCLAVAHAALAIEWDQTKNGDLTPNDVTPGSGRKVWWKCRVCGYEWAAVIKNRTRGNGCPSCDGRLANPKNCLGVSNPTLASEWHPTKNGDLTPNDVTSNSGRKVWWQCHTCGFEWDAKIANRNRGSGCPSCSGKVATAKSSLAGLSPALASEWHPTKNKDLTPSDVTCSSHKKVWWQCHVCGHDWEAKLYSRYKGSGCPLCAGRTKI
jgi:rubrerythrin